MNWQSISTERWVQVHKNLVYYFLWHGFENAEDLAQETLMAIMKRPDYEFEKEEDFPRVCLGFARKVLFKGWRDANKHAASELDPDLKAPLQDVQGLVGTEAMIFLDQVSRRAMNELSAEDIALIEAMLNRKPDDPPATSKMRVRLHRLRRKLKKLTGWQD